MIRVRGAIVVVIHRLQVCLSNLQLVRLLLRLKKEPVRGKS